jgi:hypothetical protein
LRVASVFHYPADGRRPGLGHAILTVTNTTESFDECWATAWPQVPNLRSLLLATVRPDDRMNSDKPQVSQLNSSVGTTFAGASSFIERLTRAATPAAAVIALVLGFVSVRVRRLQHASALHAGVAKSDLIAMNLLEAGAWSIAAGLIGIGCACVSSWAVPTDEQFAVFVSLAGVPLAGTMGVFVGVIAGTATAREKQVFRYFKDR